MKSEQLLQSLNLAYCELTSLLVLGSQEAASQKGKARAGSEKLALQAERVAEYVVKALKGEVRYESRPTFLRLLMMLRTACKCISANGPSAVRKRIRESITDNMVAYKPSSRD